jgi:hypothetical protein
MRGKNMKKKNCIMIVCIILTALFLCGCQEQAETQNTNINEHVEIDSDIVGLIYADLKYKNQSGTIVSADVEYLLKNIAGRQIDFSLTAEFYDKENNLLYTGGPKNFKGIVKDYAETVVSPGTNIISYNDLNAYKVDHVKIVITET